MRRARTDAGLANRNYRIGLVSGMESERMQRMREVLALELMACDARVLADGFRVGRFGIRRDDCAREAGRREKRRDVLVHRVGARQSTPSASASTPSASAAGPPSHFVSDLRRIAPNPRFRRATSPRGRSTAVPGCRLGTGALKGQADAE